MVGVFRKAGVLVFALSLMVTDTYAAQQYIATVDTQVIVERSSVFKNIGEQIEGKEITLQKLYVEKEESIKKAKEELSAKQAAMQADVYEKQLDDINQDMINFQNSLQYKSNVLQKARYSALNSVQDKVMSIVSDLAKKTGVNAVIPKGVALYAEKDLTDDLLRKLDEQMPSYVVDFKELDESSKTDTDNK